MELLKYVLFQEGTTSLILKLVPKLDSNTIAVLQKLNKEFKEFTTKEPYIHFHPI